MVAVAWKMHKRRICLLWEQSKGVFISFYLCTIPYTIHCGIPQMSAYDLASLHTISGCKRKEAHHFLCHCIKLFCRALQNRGMLDCVRLRPFNSSGSTLLVPQDVPVLHTMIGLKADDDLFHFISSINYSINISVTATVKAEARTSASQDFQSVQIVTGSTWSQVLSLLPAPW